MAIAVQSSPLLDMSKPIDVNLLDNTVQAFYGAGSNEEVSACEESCLTLARVVQGLRYVTLPSFLAIAGHVYPQSVVSCFKPA